MGMTVAQMEKRLLALTDRHRAAREQGERTWVCWHCGRRNASRARGCAECGSPGAPGDPAATAEYRELHARWMAAKAGRA